MSGSTFLSLIDEERKIPRGAIGVFPTVEDLKKALVARAELMKRIETEYANGNITAAQRDQLIDLNRRNALPPQPKK